MTKAKKGRKVAFVGYQYPCTECGLDATLGYCNGWNGAVKEGERLCAVCMYKRTGMNFFGK